MSSRFGFLPVYVPGGENVPRLFVGQASAWTGILRVPYLSVLKQRFAPPYRISLFRLVLLKADLPINLKLVIHKKYLIFAGK
jgi:hypothetical protein